MILQKHSVLKAAVIVFTFWYLVLMLLEQRNYSLIRVAIEWLILISAALFGIIFAYWKNFELRREKEKAIKGQSVRGLNSSIGFPTIHIEPLLMADKIPSRKELEQYQPPEMKGSNLIWDWRKRHLENHPEYVRLFDDGLRILAAPDYIHFYATDKWQNTGHNHGGRTLLTHTLLVCQLMLKNAKKFSEEWSSDHLAKRGRKPNLNEKGYTFDPDDPLIPIVALFHDIGKIESYTFDGKTTDSKGRLLNNGRGQINGMKYRNHDEIGARIIARLDSYWDNRIDAHSRRILSIVLANEHAPSGVPNEADGRIISARVFALLDFLIAMDTTASGIENQAKPIDAESSSSNKPEGTSWAETEALSEVLKAAEQEAVVETTAKLSIAEAITAVFRSHATLDSHNKQYRLGIHAPFYGYPEAKVAFMLEQDFIKAIAEKTGNIFEEVEIEDSQRRGNRVNPFTQKVLEELDNFTYLSETEDQYGDTQYEHHTTSLLFRFPEDSLARKRTAKTFLYQFDFVGPRHFTSATRNGNELKGGDELYSLSNIHDEWQMTDEEDETEKGNDIKKQGWFKLSNVIPLNMDAMPSHWEARKATPSKNTAIFIKARMGNSGLMKNEAAEQAIKQMEQEVENTSRDLEQQYVTDDMGEEEKEQLISTIQGLAQIDALRTRKKADTLFSQSVEQPEPSEIETVEEQSTERIEEEPETLFQSESVEPEEEKTTAQTDILEETFDSLNGEETDFGKQSKTADYLTAPIGPANYSKMTGLLSKVKKGYKKHLRQNPNTIYDIEDKVLGVLKYQEHNGNMVLSISSTNLRDQYGWVLWFDENQQLQSNIDTNELKAAIKGLIGFYPDWNGTGLTHFYFAKDSAND